MQTTTGTAAGDGGGGGSTGGRGPDNEAWREELAVAWGQTNAERGALRSQYAAVRAEIRGKFAFPPRQPRRCSAIVLAALQLTATIPVTPLVWDFLCVCVVAELKDEPALNNKFGATMDRIEKLHEKGSCFSCCLFSLLPFPSLVPS
jgi:hypothetical protein